MKMFKSGECDGGRIRIFVKNCATWGGRDRVEKLYPALVLAVVLPCAGRQHLHDKIRNSLDIGFGNNGKPVLGDKKDIREA